VRDDEEHAGLVLRQVEPEHPDRVAPGDLVDRGPVMLATLLPKMIVEPAAGGASAEVCGVLVPEPMCMHSTVPVSAQAAKNGSQYPRADARQVQVPAAQARGPCSAGLSTGFPRRLAMVSMGHRPQ